MRSNLETVALVFGTRIANTELKVRTIGTLLVEKGIITTDEYDEKYNFIVDRDLEKLATTISEELLRVSKGNDQ